MKVDDFIFIAGMTVVAACLFASLALHSDAPTHDGDVAAATICAMQEAGMTSGWQSATFHVEDGAVFIDGVIWDNPTGETIKSANTRSVSCGSVAR